MGIGDKTPCDKAWIVITGDDKWKMLIQNVSSELLTNIIKYSCLVKFGKTNNL